MVERISTGVSGLDNFISGGIPKGAVILLTGLAGSGKTIFALQFLIDGAKNGEKGIFLTFEQPREDIITQCRELSLDIEQYENSGIIEIISLRKKNLHFATIKEHIQQLVEEKKPLRFVLDSISTFSIFMEIASLVEFSEMLNIQSDKPIVIIPQGNVMSRKAIIEITDILKNMQTTSIVISELPEGSQGLSRDTISEFLTDGVIVLRYMIVGESTNRTLEIRKMRNTEIKGGNVSYIISKGGIVLEV